MLYVKKPLILIHICLFVLSSILIVRVYGAIDPDTAVAVWLFDGNTEDATENKNHGELKNGAKISGGGKFDKALSLDGEDDYVLVNPSASLESSSKQYTGVAWVKLDKEGVQRNDCCNDDQNIVSWTPGWHSLLLVFGAGRGGNQGKVEIGSAELAPQWNFGTKPVNDDKWHHLAFVYDGKKKLLYVDGEVDIDTPASGTFGIFGIDVTIGGTATSKRHAEGLLDDIAIFNAPLVKNDIKTLMDKGVGKTLGLLPVSPKYRLTAIWADIKSGI